MTATLEQLVKVRSQLAEGMMEYFQLVLDAPDRPELLPAYLGERTRTALYVSPDVLKRERRAEPLAPPSALGQREDERARRSVEEETRSKTRFAAEAQEIGEEAIYGEHERETERRVAWAEERKELERGQRAVVLAPPGQGKSLLTQMTACDLAKEAGEALLSQRLSTDDVALPFVVTLSALTNEGGRAGATPEEVLRRALATALRGLGCPEIAAKYLADHAHENRCWLFLDALDEAGDDQALTKLFTALKNWQCRVIITSRPYGYTGRLPFDVTEYRLAPLSDAQARMFVGNWFDGNEGQARMNDLLARSRSVQQVSQNPFLLTLLCWVAERRELSKEITRTQLYDRVTRDLLGLPVNGAGDVDDQRANEWLPLLTELAFTFFQENAGREPISSERLLSLIAASDKRPVPLGLTPIQTANLTPRQQATYLLDEVRQKRVLVPLTRDRAAYVAPHRSFLEYFTGCALADEAAKMEAGEPSSYLARKSVWEFVDVKASYPDWREAIIFMGGKLTNPTSLLELLVDEKKGDLFHHRWALAAHCLAELNSVIYHLSSAIVNRITTAVFSLWWEHEVNGTVAAVPHLTRALPALGQINGLVGNAYPANQLSKLIDAQLGNSKYDLPLLDLIATLLREPDVRYTALKAIEALGASAATPDILAVLVALVRDAPESLKYTVAPAIRALGAAAATPDFLAALLALLREDVVGGKRASDAIEDSLDAAIAAAEKTMAADAIGALGAAAATPEVLKTLLAWLRDPAGSGPYEVVRAIGLLGTAAATSDILVALITFLSNRIQPYVVVYAIGAMGTVAATPEALAALLVLLRDTNDDMLRIEVSDAIGALGAAAATPEVMTALLALLRNTDWNVRTSAVRAIERLGAAAATAEVLTTLLAWSHDANAWVRAIAARAIGALGKSAATPEILAALLVLMRDAECDRLCPGSVRGEAVPAIRSLGAAAATPEILAALLALLHNAESGVKHYAADAIGAMGAAVVTPEVLTTLLAWSRDPDAHVREAVAIAIGALGAEVATPEVLAVLLVLLRDAESDLWSSLVRTSALHAIGLMGSAAATPEILEALLALLQDAEHYCPNVTRIESVGCSFPVLDL